MSHVLPVKRQTKQAQTLIVHGAAKQVCENGGLLACGMHGGKTGDRNGVEPRPDVSRKEFVEEHADKAVPEPAKRLGSFEVLPVEALERLDGWEGAPVDGVDMPDGKGTHYAADAIAKQAD
jgi:hypothetical protein